MYVFSIHRDRLSLKSYREKKKAWEYFHGLSSYTFKIFSHVTLLAIQKLNKIEKIKQPWLTIDIKT